MPYQVDHPQEAPSQRVVPALFVLIISVGMMLAQAYFSWPALIKSYLYAYIYNPLNELVTTPLDFSIDTIASLQQDQTTEQAYLELVVENRFLRAQLQQYGHFQAENRRLRMLMDSVLTVTDPVLIAELLSADIDGYNETIVINKGRKNAVHLHQTVIDPYGLVGQVTEVYEDSAKVMLISDARSRVPAYIERNFLRVVVLGNSERGVLTMPWQRHDGDIRIGDTLISSGLGGIYPRGYPIATVTAIDRGNDTSFLTIELAPIAHLSSMLEVLLLDSRVSDNTGRYLPIDVGPPSSLISPSRDNNSSSTNDAAQ